jgi:hypothetical protein
MNIFLVTKISRQHFRIVPDDDQPSGKNKLLDIYRISETLKRHLNHKAGYKLILSLKS